MTLAAPSCQDKRRLAGFLVRFFRISGHGETSRVLTCTGAPAVLPVKVTAGRHRLSRAHGTLRSFPVLVSGADPASARTAKPQVSLKKAQLNKRLLVLAGGGGGLISVTSSPASKEPATSLYGSYFTSASPSRSFRLFWTLG